MGWAVGKFGVGGLQKNSGKLRLLRENCGQIDIGVYTFLLEGSLKNHTSSQIFLYFVTLGVVLNRPSHLLSNESKKNHDFLNFGKMAVPKTWNLVVRNVKMTEN